MTSAENTLSGYASIVRNVLLPLNQNKKFKRLFKDKKFKILMSCPTWINVPLVTIDKGTIQIDSVKSKPAERINKDVLGWNAYLEMNIILYTAILMKRKSLKDLAKEWLKGEIKFKGIKYFPDLIKLFKCFYKEKLIYEPPTE